MYKKQMLVQRIICYVVLAAAALVFIYSLGLVTDLHYNNFAYYSENPERPKFEGAEIYREIQPFNSQLTAAGIVLILSAVLLFVFSTHSRRRYYIGNYITIALNAVLSIGVAIFGVVNVIKYREMYFRIDFEELERWQGILRKPYSISPFWFDIGFYVFGFVILATLLSLCSLAFKVYVMRGEKKLLAGSEEVTNG